MLCSFLYRFEKRRSAGVVFGGGFDLSPGLIRSTRIVKDFGTGPLTICASRFGDPCLREHKRWCDDNFYLRHPRRDPRYWWTILRY